MACLIHTYVNMASEKTCFFRLRMTTYFYRQQVKVHLHSGDGESDLILKTEKIRYTLDPDWLSIFGESALSATVGITPGNSIVFSVFDWDEVGKDDFLYVPKWYLSFSAYKS